MPYLDEVEEDAAEDDEFSWDDCEEAEYVSIPTWLYADIEQFLKARQGSPEVSKLLRDLDEHTFEDA